MEKHSIFELMTDLPQICNAVIFMTNLHQIYDVVQMTKWFLESIGVQFSYQ